MDGEKQKELLEDTIKRYDYLDLLYITGVSGMQTARSSGTLGDRSGRFWYIQMMKDKKDFVSKSYYSLKSNVAVTSVYFPINDDAGNMVAIMGSDIKLDAIQKKVEEFSAGKGSYAYILDGEGAVVAHPDKKQVAELYNYKTLKKTTLVMGSDGKVKLDANGGQVTELKDIPVPDKLKEITELAIQGESGVVEYRDLEKKDVISAYTSVKIPGNSANWVVITVQDKNVAMSFVKGVFAKNMLMSLVIFVLAIILIFFLAKAITGPITKIKEKLEIAAEGDLTIVVEELGQNEIGKLGKSVNKMIGSGLYPLLYSG